MIGDFLKRIRENWQLLATLLITWSVFDLYNFYRPFGIEIQSYVSISELLLLSFPTLLNGIYSMITVTVLVIFIKIPTTTNGDIDNNFHTEEPGIFRINNKLRLLKGHFTTLSIRNIHKVIFQIISILGDICQLVIIAYIGYRIFALYNSNLTDINFSTYRSRVVLLLFITIFFLTPLFIIVSAFFNRYSNKNLSTLIISSNPIGYFVLAFVVNSIISNRVQYLSIINGKQEKILSFSYSGKEIRTDSTVIYIGSTESYIFFRDNSKKESVILKKTQIDNIKIKEK